MSREKNIPWLLGISATLLLALMPYSGYIAALPFIQDEWHLSNAQSGVVFSSNLVGYALSSLLLIPLADRLSPRRMMAAGVATMVVANLLFAPLAHGFWSASILRFAAGAGHVMTYILGIQLVSKRFTGRMRGTAVGLYVGTGYAGTTVSYTLFGLLLGVIPAWRTVYLTTAVLSVAGLVLALMLTRGEAALAAASAPGPDVEETQFKAVGRLDLSVLRQKPVALVILAYALHTAELYLARLWFPLLLGAALMAHGWAAAEATARAVTLSGLMFMTGIGGVFAGGYLSDRIGRANGGILVLVLSGACSFAAGWLLGTPLAVLIGLGFVYGFVTAADSAIYSTAAVELSPPGRVGSVQAAQSFIGFSVGAVVPVVAGAILDHASAAARWGWAFSFNGVLAVMAIVGLLWLRRILPGGKMLSPQA